MYAGLAELWCFSLVSGLNVKLPTLKLCDNSDKSACSAKFWRNQKNSVFYPSALNFLFRYAFRTRRLWISWMVPMLPVWPKKYNCMQMSSHLQSPRLKNKTQNRFVLVLIFFLFHLFVSIMLWMCILFLITDLNNSCYILQDINTRLKNIINGAPCVLFMKGSPQEPRCGKQFAFKNNFLSNF